MRRILQLKSCALILALSLVSMWQLNINLAAEESDDTVILRGQFDVTRMPAQLIDQETIDSMSDVLDANVDNTWKMYVPDSYDPGRPAGLMVYISPTPKGWMPRGWQSIFDEQNLIWISADESGNDTHSVLRMLYAVLAPNIASESYNIDADRIYLSGFSGGGKMAGMVAIHFANVFRGAIYICGAEFWTDDPPRFFPRVQANRYVFVTGDDDFNRNLTRRIYRRYKRAGVPNIELMIINGMGHTTPGEAEFRKAINFLDKRD